MFSTIKIATAIAVLAAGVSAQSNTTPVTGKLGDAKVITDNPAGVAYVASFVPNSKSNIQGAVLALTSADKVGVNFQVALSGLPSEGGPFLYHVHDNPISADGNCTSAGAHVDPFQRGEDPVCDPKSPKTCQTGDLSGKYGKPTNETFSANYVDKFTSLNPDNGAFAGNRSIVIHLANKTRIACANFTSYTNTTTSGNTTVSLNGTSSSSSTSSEASHTGSHTSSSSGSSGSASSSATSAVSTGAAAQVWADSGLVMMLGAVALFAM